MTDLELTQVFAEEWPRLVAILMRDLGDLELAEDVAQEAFLIAADHWPTSGVPDRPGAWLVTTARRKAIDRIRRRRRFDDRLEVLVEAAEIDDRDDAGPLEGGTDAQLAMLFGCCHPGLDTEAQIALTLRHVGGLTTTQIAAAFLVPEATMGRRLSRAMTKIAAAGVPFRVPAEDEFEDRLAAVLAVIYLVFTTGHTASDPEHLVRGDLCDEARWLGALVVDCLPQHAEALGLSALMAFTDARRSSRVDASGDLVLLADQDRTGWDRVAIDAGHRTLERALRLDAVGPFQLQAAIAGTHASAERADDTDWRLIAHLYRRLHQRQPTPVVALNSIVAESMVHGPEVGLDLLGSLAASGRLDGYRYLPATRADLLRRAGRWVEATKAYDAALALTPAGPERRFLTRRRAEALDAADRPASEIG